MGDVSNEVRGPVVDTLASGAVGFNLYPTVRTLNGVRNRMVSLVKSLRYATPSRRHSPYPKPSALDVVTVFAGKSRYLPPVLRRERFMTRGYQSEIK
ncbi:hypothetical protein EVAR_82114_1 [Eumeta japonica]|uniref:Uncharacterized protein n=1 Tax=Eumeta variegata TaxID=151549 RepID=A0A4C1U1Q6_EUMVA|nr:hypothetical protein EVAR_82114_1 [Eumeta japonica]